MALYLHVKEIHGASEGFQWVDKAPLFPQQFNKLKVSTKKDNRS
jgi:hypothetical protein